MKSFAPACLSAALLASDPAGAAEAARPPAHLTYALTIAGLPIARADARFDDRGGRYAIGVEWHTTGIAGILSAASGSLSASGRLSPTQIGPRAYRLVERNGDTPFDVDMGLSAGRVTRLAVDPPAKTGEDIVPVLPEHRVGVGDPLSAAFLPARTAPEAICARVLPIFDGWSRWNVRLTAKSIETTAPDGLRGPVVTCAARWVPIAGHRSGHRSVRYMAANEDVEIRLARLADRDWWLPIEASVGTMIGTVRVGLRSVEPAGD